MEKQQGRLRSSCCSAGGRIHYFYANRLHHTGTFSSPNKYCINTRTECDAPLGAGSRPTDQMRFSCLHKVFGRLDYSQISHTQQEDTVENEQNPKKESGGDGEDFIRAAKCRLRMKY